MNSEEHYQKIADVLNRHAPNGWQKAWVDAVMNDHSVEQTYDYENGSGGVDWFDVEDITDSFAISDSLRSLQNFMAEQTGDKWKKVRFTLHADGTFNTKFEYDD